MASTLLKDVKPIDIYGVLLVGSLSIIYEAAFITGIGGRYSGFYLNPNLAGFACILGYAFSFAIDRKELKITGQILFSIAGLVTFSRTFLLIWILINLLSVLISYQNVFKIVICAVLFVAFLSLGDKFDLNSRRLSGFSSILSGEVNQDLKEGSRTETWALYYEQILNKPVWGSGYRTFSGETGGSEASGRFLIKSGVHNAFLMILGEAGFFLLLYFLWIYGNLIINGVKFFKIYPSIFFLSFSLIAFMLTNHSYFDNYLVLLASLWLYHETYKLKNSSNSGTIEFNKALFGKNDFNFKPLSRKTV